MGGETTLARKSAAFAAAAVTALGLSGCGVIGGDVTLSTFSAPDLAVEASAPAPGPVKAVSGGDKLREAVVKYVPFNVSLWLRQDARRQFMVQRQDLQPMFATDWSEQRAKVAVSNAYSDECGPGAVLSFQNAVWDPVGVWVVDGVCGPTLSWSQASALGLPRPRPTGLPR